MYNRFGKEFIPRWNLESNFLFVKWKQIDLIKTQGKNDIDQN